MKKLLLICVMAFTAVSMWADDKVICFTVVEKDGSEVYFALRDYPVGTYADNTLIMSLSGEAVLEVPIADIVKHYFTTSVPTISGIESTPTVDGSLTEFAGGKAYVTGLAPGQEVCVYTSAGQMVITVVASAEGNACVDFGGLKSGEVYLLRTPSTTYKLINR